MSKKIISYGAKVERSEDGNTWGPVVEAKGVAIPAPEQDYADATSLDSPNGFKEYLPGLKDAGTLELPCHYTSAGYKQQLADRDSGAAIHYRVTLKLAEGQATGDVFKFRAYPLPKTKDNGLGETIGMDVALKITGDVQWEEGTAA